MDNQILSISFFSNEEKMMKYLTEEYWKEINNNSKINKGIAFECLVKQLLIAEYGEGTFQNTKYSWDGSKDFFYYSEESNIWAECKNYSSGIDLKVLAATLVMAQISSIDVILFYSYSHINLNTKAKVLLSAKKENKTVYFFDDEVLEQKIFQYWDYVGKKFFNSFHYEKNKYSFEQSYETKCLLFGNPLDNTSSIEEYQLSHVALFKMFEMNIVIINRTNAPLNISLDFENNTAMKKNFEIYFEDRKNLKSILELQPYQGKNICIWLIPVQLDCTIPHPYINNSQISIPKNIEFKSLVVENQNNKRLIGKSYEYSLEDFKEYVLYETVKFKLGIFYGHSGTGKSKLYEECLKWAKIKGYDIINFHNLTDIQKTTSINEFLQKMVAVLYDVSLDIIKQIISLEENIDLLNCNKIEYQMLISIFNINNCNDIHQWINNYLEIITLKLAEKRVLIAIDDIQFFNDEIIDLIDRICRKLIKLEQCKSRFLLVFNLDYIKRNSKADIFLGNYTKSESICLKKQVSGFENSKECFEFLQETFSIGSVFQNGEIEEISTNLNKNPFYLEQMIYWLRDEKVIKKVDNQYIVNDAFRLRTLIRTVPETVYEILEKRWEHYKKNSSSYLKKVQILFSALHLYGELDQRELDQLQITKEILKELENMGFIRTEYSANLIITKFYHNLIDDFLSKKCSNFSEKIIIYEYQEKNIIRNSDFRYCMGILYSKENLSINQLEEALALSIDNRIAYEFYPLLFDKALTMSDLTSSQNQEFWLRSMYKIIICIHDILGNNIMEKYANRFFYKIHHERQLFQALLKYMEYGKLIIYISEAYDSMGNYKEAVKLIKDYKEKALESPDDFIENIEKQQLLAEIYNRLHVYYRHQKSCPLEDKTTMSYLNKSIEIANKISYTTMQYVNCSDKGYLYYNLPLSDEKHLYTIEYWERACQIYENGGAERKELNYLRKKVQLSLLSGESQQAVSNAKNGLEQIELSEYAYQQTFFKWWFYHALAEGYLLEYNNINNDEIESALERAHFYSELLNSNKKFYYLQLKSIYMHYLGKTNIAIELNQEALDQVKHSNYKNKIDYLKAQLTQNQQTLSAEHTRTSTQLYSQIYTRDKLFNLPCM